MPNKPVILLAGTDCDPELDEQFNEWYNEDHIPKGLESEFLEGVTRYKMAFGTELTEDARSAAANYPKYLAVYEFKNKEAFDAWQKSDAVAETRKGRRARWGKTDGSGLEGMEVKWKVVYEPLRSWHK